jgi:cobalt/nickel transport system ATP-binding protein
MDLIRLENITYAYRGRTPVLDHLRFSLEPGGRVGLIGPTGCGKTTLLFHIMGLLKPQEGSLSLFGRTIAGEKDFAAVRRRVGFLFQNADDQLFNPTVIEDVAFGPLNLGARVHEARETALQTLSELGMEDFADRLTHKLSGGEKRLVALATVLAMKPEILLLDEPTTGLDPSTKSHLAAILNRKRLPCIIASHEYDFLIETTDRLVALEGGKIVTDAESLLHTHHHAHHLGKVPHKHE